MSKIYNEDDIEIDIYSDKSLVIKYGEEIAGEHILTVKYDLIQYINRGAVETFYHTTTSPITHIIGYTITHCAGMTPKDLFELVVSKYYE